MKKYPLKEKNSINVTVNPYVSTFLGVLWGSVNLGIQKSRHFLQNRSNLKMAAIIYRE